ncbi:hypothetical protein BGX38DRAFT_154146 [Terfezia claveryi]|nr:hypothetical protein BGX38DRAFT_154146 [Terfezia claveryi]
MRPPKAGILVSARPSKVTDWMRQSMVDGMFTAQLQSKLRRTRVVSGGKGISIFDSLFQTRGGEQAGPAAVRFGGGAARDMTSRYILPSNPVPVPNTVHIKHLFLPLTGRASRHSSKTEGSILAIGYGFTCHPDLLEAECPRQQSDLFIIMLLRRIKMLDEKNPTNTPK